jgi:hypothetical protein
MPTKVGRIAALRRTGPRFVQVELDSGDRVEVQHPLWEHVTNSYPADTQLVFVERRGRLFRFVQWVGTPEEARQAVSDGVLRDDELPTNLAQGVDDQDPDWAEWALRSVHMMVETSRAQKHDEFLDWAERLHQVTVLAPFPDLREHLAQLMNSEEPAVKKQAFDAMMSWCQRRLETHPAN